MAEYPPVLTEMLMLSMIWACLARQSYKASHNPLNLQGRAGCEASVREARPAQGSQSSLQLVTLNGYQCSQLMSPFGSKADIGQMRLDVRS